MTKIKVVQHVHAADDEDKPIYDKTTEPWTVVYGHFTTTDDVDHDTILPEGNGNVYWDAVPRPVVLGDEYQLVGADYDGDSTVNAYWQNTLPVE